MVVPAILATRERPAPRDLGSNQGPQIVTGITVIERLVCSPSTKAIRLHSPAGSLMIFACGNRAGRCCWSTGFLEDIPFPPALPFRCCSILTSITLTGSQDPNVKSRPNIFTHTLTLEELQWSRDLLLLCELAVPAGLALGSGRPHPSQSPIGKKSSGVVSGDLEGP
ncbi:hypothetical protein PR048_000294 [Dryococelus australis]|uniref:Uncharacterized protein n=1 Tax=Dryococelus australis TaxID=614101 RepID=A0ABQ9IE99_9NEOP|nr:hypothetical protein PR048_000294 [Dryococelus australis]